MVHAYFLSGHTEHHHFTGGFIGSCRRNTRETTESVLAWFIPGHYHDRSTSLANTGIAGHFAIDSIGPDDGYFSGLLAGQRQNARYFASHDVRYRREVPIQPQRFQPGRVFRPGGRITQIDAGVMQRDEIEYESP